MLDTQAHKMVQVDIPHEFKGDTEMVSEVEVLDHVDDIVLVIAVLQQQRQPMNKTAMIIKS